MLQSEYDQARIREGKLRSKALVRSCLEPIDETCKPVFRGWVEPQHLSVIGPFCFKRRRCLRA